MSIFTTLNKPSHCNVLCRYAFHIILHSLQQSALRISNLHHDRVTIDMGGEDVVAPKRSMYKTFEVKFQLSARKLTVRVSSTEIEVEKQIPSRMLSASRFSELQKLKAPTPTVMKTQKSESQPASLTFEFRSGADDRSVPRSLRPHASICRGRRAVEEKARCEILRQNQQQDAFRQKHEVARDVKRKGDTDGVEGERQSLTSLLFDCLRRLTRGREGREGRFLLTRP